MAKRVVFRFGGFGDLPGAELGLPLIPVHISPPQAKGGRLLNAIIDSGSHRTVFPFEVAEKLGLTDLQFGERLGTALRMLRTAPAVLDLDVVDSHFPTVSHWSFDRMPVEIADPSTDLPMPLIGLDLLNHFETCLNPKEGYLLLRRLTAPS